MKKIITNKYFIITAAILILAVFFIFSANDQPEDSYVEVERGDLAQEIFETGSTEKGSDISLSFQDGGKIGSVLVSEGETIQRGAVVARADKRDLEISLREAKAALSSSKASLERLLSGAIKEDVEVARSAVDSAEAELLSAERNLEEQENVTDEMLREAYQGTPSFLGDVYSTVRDVELEVLDIAKKYFLSVVVEETTSGRKSRDAIRRSARKIEKYNDAIQREDMTFSEKEDALKETNNELKNITRELDNLIDVSQSDFYEDRFTDEEKDLLRSLRRTINSTVSEVSSLIGSISSVNAQVSATLTSARAGVDSAKSALVQAEKNLAQVRRDPSVEDVRVKESTVDQAKAKVESLENKIEDTVLRSPVSGTVSDVLMRKGEVASPASPLVIITPEEDIQIAIDIYEGDIASVSVGDPVTTSFVAFPDKDFHGEVVFVNPTGKVIDGVVYYKVKVVLDEYPENTLPQMTVDVTIKTEEKEDVLLLSDRAIQRREGKSFVKVLENGEHVEKEVKTGITGGDRTIEIVSGVEEGEKVLID